MGITGVTYDSDYKETPKRYIVPVEMIQELRIGDYILFDGELLRVNLDFFELLFHLKEADIKSKLGGLEITEDLLLSIGFVKQKNYEWDGEKEYETNPYYFSRQLEVWNRYSAPGIFYRDGFFILGGSYPELKYLHQLQNFFICKAGEELIINKDKLKEYYEKVRRDTNEGTV